MAAKGAPIQNPIALPNGITPQVWVLWFAYICEQIGNNHIIFTADNDDDYAFEISCNANGFGDIKALEIDYATGAITTGTEEEVIFIGIDQVLSTGGKIAALEILTTTVGSAEVYGLRVGVGVNAIDQFAGEFEDADSLLVNAVDELTALSTGGAGNVSVFVADNDTITIGNSVKFEELEIIVNTGANRNVNPTFEYSTGVGTWGTFTPADGTNGFMNTGEVLWADADIPTWATGAGSEYLIRITRTRNSLSTTPILDLLEIAVVTEHIWDKDGNLEVNGVTAVGTTNTLTVATMTTTQRDAMTAVNGMIIYNATTAVFNFYENGAWVTK